jgi:hypothetical protein
MPVAHAERLPEVLRRYVSASLEDFVTRGEAAEDLERIVDAIAFDALEKEQALDPGVTTDGVSFDSASMEDRSFEFHGQLWLLGANESRGVPLHATFWLSDDLNAVTAYEIRIAHTRREARPSHPGRQSLQDWPIIVRMDEGS